jgi:hypothetical protein
MNAAGSIFDSQEFRAPSGAGVARAIAHRIDPERWTVFITLAGDVSVEALHALRDRITSDPAFSPGMNVCVECRVMTSVPSDADIRTLALSTVRHRATSIVGRVAIVALTERSYEAACVFELYADAGTDRLAVFTDPVRARAWLSING